MIYHGIEMDNSENKIEHYTQAIELNPDDAEAYFKRGNAYASKGEYNLAIQDYDKAIELAPDTLTAYYNRGNANVYKGEYDRAIQDYDKAIELKPDFADTYYIKAFALVRKQKKDEALNNLEIAANKGYKNIKFARTDKALNSLRDDPRFEVIMKKIEENAKGK